MAKATVTFEDQPDGGFNISVEFDPPMTRPESGDWNDAEVTPAQTAASIAVQAVQRATTVEEESE